MNCKYCDFNYKDREEERNHMGCLTHHTNVYNYCMLARKKKDDTDYLNRENAISDYKSIIEDGNFNCIKCNWYTKDKDEMIQHEESCLHVRLKKIEPIYECLTCDDCGFEVQLKGQKMKPKYMMARHKKKCSHLLEKKMRQELKQSISTLDSDKLRKMYLILKN